MCSVGWVSGRPHFVKMVDARPDEPDQRFSFRFDAIVCADVSDIAVIACTLCAAV